MKTTTRLFSLAPPALAVLISACTREVTEPGEGATSALAATCPLAPETKDIMPSTTPAPACDSTHFVKTADIPYAAGGASRTLDLYLPSGGTGPFPTVIWIHGGGWQRGDKSQWAPAQRLLCRGYAVASINYRLSGEAKFPAQIHDVKAAIRYLRANASTLGLDGNKFVASGSSAGGHLAALAGTSGDVTALEDLSLGNAGVSSRVLAVVDLYGPVDFGLMDSQIAAQVGCGGTNHGGPLSPESALLGCTVSSPACSDEVQAAAPTSYVSADDPPFFIMHGNKDCNVALAQSGLLHTTLRGAGVCSAMRTVLGAGHGDPLWTAPEVHDEIATFLDAVIAGAPDDGPSPATVECSAFRVTGTPASTTGATWTYESTDLGVAYRLEGVLFAPAGAGPFPGVVVSHGKNGSPYSYSRQMARDIAGWGAVAIGTMYTHATLDIPANLPDGPDGASEANVLRAHKARDLLSCLGTVDLRRVGLHGHSMGAYVTAQVAGTYPKDFLVASHTAGGVGDGVPQTKPEVAARIVAPYQIHVGTDDGQLIWDRKLAEILTAQGIVHELNEYDFPDNDHNRIMRDRTMLERVKVWYTTHGLLP